MLAKNLIKNFKIWTPRFSSLNSSLSPIKLLARNNMHKYFSEAESSSSKQINIYKIIKTGENSVYDLPYGYNSSNDFTERDSDPNQIKQNFFTNSEIMQKLSSMLKELEIGKASSSKQSKFQEVRKSITLLNQEEIKNELMKLSSSIEILEKTSTEIKDNSAEVLKLMQTRNELSNRKYEEKDLNSFLKHFLELGKYFLKNDFYSLEHNINIPSRINKDTLVKFLDSKKILEIFNFSQLTIEQMITVLPTFIMINNLYVLPENVIEDLIIDVSSKLFNPISANARGENPSDLLTRYFVFLLVNNNLTKSTLNLDYLTLYKDVLSKYANGGLNDILYILTENIFRFINVKHESILNKQKTQTHPNIIVSFDSFLRSYMSNLLVLAQNEKTNSSHVNFDLVEYFLYSLILLKESSYSENILTSALADQIRHFINKGIFNQNIIKKDQSGSLLNVKEKTATKSKSLLNLDTFKDKEVLKEFCKRPNSVELLLEVENKLFLTTNQESEELSMSVPDSIFTVLNSNKFIPSSNSDHKRYKDIMINSYIHFSEKKQSLVKSLSQKILTESFGVNLSVNEVDYLLNSLCKYDVKEAKLFFDLMSPFLISKRKQITPANFVSLLYCISKYNLVDVYDLHPLFVEFFFSFEEKKFRSEIKNNLPKILFTLANFALRTKEFNPLFKEMALNLPQYLKENFNSSNTDNLDDILLSLAVVELCMKYNLTDIDFGNYFSAELLTSLLNLHLLKMKNEKNVKKFVENFGIDKISYDYTNLQIFNILMYKDHSIPVILINDSDYNLNGKFISSVYIRYNHLKSYLNKPPMILDVDRVKSKDEVEKEVLLYWKNPSGVYKNYII